MKSIFSTLITGLKTYTSGSATEALSSIHITGDPCNPSRYLILAQWSQSANDINARPTIELVASQEKDTTEENGHPFYPNTIKILSQFTPLTSVNVAKIGSAFTVTDSLWGGYNLSLIVDVSTMGTGTFSIRDVSLTAIKIPEDLMASDDFFWIRRQNDTQINMDIAAPFVGDGVPVPVMLAGGSSSSRGANILSSTETDSRWSQTFGLNNYGGSINAAGGRYLIMAQCNLMVPDGADASPRDLKWNSRLAAFQPDFVDPENPYIPNGDGRTIFPYYSDRLIPFLGFDSAHTASGEGGVAAHNYDATLASHTSDWTIPILHAGIVDLHPGQTNVAFSVRLKGDAGEWGTSETTLAAGVTVNNINVILMPLDGYFDYYAKTFAPHMIKDGQGSVSPDIDQLILAGVTDARNESVNRGVIDIAYTSACDSTDTTTSSPGPPWGSIMELSGDGSPILTSSFRPTDVPEPQYVSGETLASILSPRTAEISLSLSSYNELNEPLESTAGGGNDDGLLVGGGFFLRFFDRMSNRDDPISGLPNSMIRVEKELNLEWSLGGTQNRPEIDGLTSKKISSIVDEGTPIGVDSGIEIIDNTVEYTVVAADDTLLGYAVNVSTGNIVHYDTYPLSNRSNPWSP